MTHLKNNPIRVARKSAVASALAAAIGGCLLCHSALAADFTFSFSGSSNEGLFTMLDTNGNPLGNTSYPYYGDPTWGYGLRTQITGTLTIDTNTLAGSMTIQPFQFFNGGPAAAHNITFTDVSGDPVNTAGHTLLLGNMLFDWNGSNNIPVSIVWDASGLAAAINGGLVVGDTVSGGAGCASCATPASNGIKKNSYPIGTAPLATTVFDTSNTGAPNYTGTTPLINDTTLIGGSPMQTPPFAGFNANFDISTLTLIDDGSGPAFTQPADVTFTAPEQDTPTTINVNLGTVTDEASGVTIDYSIDGGNTWKSDDGSTNTIAINATDTTTTLSVEWRATSSGGSTAFKTQKVTVTITDTMPPVFTPPPDITGLQVNSTSDNVCFGTITATDNVDSAPRRQWSIDGFNWTNDNNTDNCSTGFGPNANTVHWRAIDDTGNTTTHQQTVTLILPTGITGKACTIDLTTAGPRQVEGRFTMRDSTGNIVGTVDTGVTGQIDTTVFCSSPDLSVCNPNPPAVTLYSGQPFYGFNWTASPVRLFDAGTWTFEACPNPLTGGTIGKEDWTAGDGSSQCPAASGMGLNDPLSMTVNPGQIGAHMLFDWSTNVAIDVAVVWDVGCGQYQLTTTDPDGDGILGTKMVDGPFKGFNAAFDLKTTSGQPPIAEGGYTVTIPTVQNPVSGASPFVLPTTNTVPSVEDTAAVRSCVGDCFSFTTTELLSKTDGAGNYQVAQVALPLTEATPFWSLFRKFDTGTNTWKPFVIDTRNDVKTAPLDGGQCPQPGSGNYDRPNNGLLPGKLRAGDLCVQLTIEDGGPNDADGAVNGSVSDPGGVAEVAAPALPSPSTSSGGCSLSTTPASAAKGGAWWLLAGFLGWLGWKRRGVKLH